MGLLPTLARENAGNISLAYAILVSFAVMGAICAFSIIMDKKAKRKKN